MSKVSVRGSYVALVSMPRRCVPEKRVALLFINFSARNTKTKEQKSVMTSHKIKIQKNNQKVFKEASEEIFGAIIRLRYYMKLNVIAGIHKIVYKLMIILKCRRHDLLIGAFRIFRQAGQGGGARRTHHAPSRSERMCRRSACLWLDPASCAGCPNTGLPTRE